MGILSILVPPKENYCNSEGLCTLSDVDIQRCKYWSPGRNKFCKHEKKVYGYEYECLNTEARAVAGAEEI